MNTYLAQIGVGLIIVIVGYSLIRAYEHFFEQPKMNAADIPAAAVNAAVKARS